MHVHAEHSIDRMLPSVGNRIQSLLKMLFDMLFQSKFEFQIRFDIVPAAAAAVVLLSVHTGFYDVEEMNLETMHNALVAYLCVE